MPELTMTDTNRSEVSRRTFLKASAATSLLPALTGLAAAEAVADALEQDDVTAAVETSATLADAASQGSVDQSTPTGIERSQPHALNYSQRSVIAKPAQHRRTAPQWPDFGRNGRRNEAVQPRDWSPRQAAKQSGINTSGGRPAVATNGAVDRRDAGGAYSARPVSEAATFDTRPYERFSAEPVSSSSEASQSGPATEAGWTLASWWQSISALNPRKRVQLQRRVKA